MINESEALVDGYLAGETYILGDERASLPVFPS
jgi:hypothetical protein